MVYVDLIPRKVATCKTLASFVQTNVLHVLNFVVVFVDLYFIVSIDVG